MRLLLFILVFLPSTLFAEDWPEFRGPTGQGISTAHDVPIEWSAEKNVAWKVDVPGLGWSSPVLARGRIYLTTALPEGPGYSLRVLCFNASNGSMLWNVEALKADAKDANTKHSKNSPASPTPIVTGDRIYAHFGHLGTAALDLSGKVVWRQTTLKYPPVHGNGGSPLLFHDELIFSCDGGRDPFIVALDARSGDVRWKTPRNTQAGKTFSFSTPLAINVDGSDQIISPASGMVAAYDPTHGKEIWRVRYGDGYSVVPRPVFAGGVILVSSGFDRPMLYAVHPQGAAGDASSSHVAWTLVTGAPCTPSVVAFNDLVFSISDAGIATCVDVATGKVHWTHRLSGGYSASPIEAEGNLYFPNEDGVTYVVRAADKFALLATNDLEERCLASPAVTEGALYFRTEKHLWKIGK